MAKRASFIATSRPVARSNLFRKRCPSVSLSGIFLRAKADQLGGDVAYVGILGTGLVVGPVVLEGVGNVVLRDVEVAQVLTDLDVLRIQLEGLVVLGQRPVGVSLHVEDGAEIHVGRHEIRLKGDRLLEMLLRCLDVAVGEGDGAQDVICAGGLRVHLEHAVGRSLGQIIEAEVVIADGELLENQRILRRFLHGLFVLLHGAVVVLLGEVEIAEPPVDERIVRFPVEQLLIGEDGLVVLIQMLERHAEVEQNIRVEEIGAAGLLQRLLGLQPQLLGEQVTALHVMGAGFLGGREDGLLDVRFGAFELARVQVQLRQADERLHLLGVPLEDLPVGFDGLGNLPGLLEMAGLVEGLARRFAAGGQA
jgi:hypothetical protein